LHGLKWILFLGSRRRNDRFFHGRLNAVARLGHDNVVGLALADQDGRMG